MKILVVGLGSMGRRIIRLLKKIESDIQIVGVDSKIERCERAEKEFGIDTCLNLAEAFETKTPDLVVISPSPHSHAAIIKESLMAGCHVFTELNLVADGYEENIKLANDLKKTLFLSSTFLYRDEIQYIENQVKHSSGRLNYIYHVGQYLPDWHP